MKPPGMDENFDPYMDTFGKIADSFDELDEAEKEMFNEVLFKPVLFEAEKV
jgi:hypothetical protein